MPKCARCVASGASCVFVQSRRGHRKGTSTKLSSSVEVPVSAAVPEIDFLFTTTTPTVPSDLPSTEMPSSGDPTPNHTAPPAAHTSSRTTTLSEETVSMPTGPPIDDIHDEHLIEAYYRYIHPAHPFILPRKYHLRDRNVFPRYLRNAICFIASHHRPSEECCPETYQAACYPLFDPNVVEDGFKVQGLLLYTLASYARFERDKGNRALTTAAEVALRIGLNSNFFGARDQDPVLRESWRRTWWELYTITGLISLISGSSFRLSQPRGGGGMTLPTSCEEYDACQFHSPLKTTDEMHQRFQTELNFPWSSFAYRIEAMRILSIVLDLTEEATPSRGRAANASISSYMLALPADKREGLKPDGDVDEVMSCALMIIHLASICLHFPRSTLARLRGFKTVCGSERTSIPAEETRAHRTAALNSAKALGDLLSARPSLKTVSPCFSCAIAFAAVAQLGEFLLLCQQQQNATANSVSESDSLREYIQLELSALNALGETWPIARVVRGQIAQFSREILTTTATAAVNTSGKPSTGEMLSEFVLPLEPPPMPDEQWLQDLINEDLGLLPGLE